VSSETHTHEWVKAEQGGILAWRCKECAETSATCGTCERASGTTLLLCPSCEKAAAKVLDDIQHALDQWVPNPRSPMHSPGDMRLVLSSGQGAGVTSPSDIDAKLWSWVGRWAEHSGAGNAYALDYLRSRHIWAAHNPEASDWLGYLKAMRSLRRAARRIAGLLPQRLNEPCAMCGGSVVQDWSDGDWMPFEDGLSDVVRCTKCDMTWGDRAHWRFMTRQHIVELPGQHGRACCDVAEVGSAVARRGGGSDRASALLVGRHVRLRGWPGRLACMGWTRLAGAW
jgi:hypothetical protein